MQKWTQKASEVTGFSLLVVAGEVTFGREEWNIIISVNQSLAMKFGSEEICKKHKIKFWIWLLWHDIKTTTTTMLVVSLGRINVSSVCAKTRKCFSSKSHLHTFTPASVSHQKVSLSVSLSLELFWPQQFQSSITIS